MNARRLITWFHVAVGALVTAYFYSPLKELDATLPVFQYLVLPLTGLSGLYLWQGHRLRRWLK